MINRFRYLTAALLGIVLVSSCDEQDVDPSLVIPSYYTSADYASNVATESTVIEELITLSGALNSAEADAQSVLVEPISYPATLSSVTLPNYRVLVEGWLVELEKSANDDDGFQNPGFENPSEGEEGGLLGGRLLDEHGLELEQNIEKGSFGAALYNHALTIINGDLSDPSVIDKLVEIYGTSPSFEPSEATAAATYSRRRSNQTTETGFFYDIRQSLITAKAAIEAGVGFQEERDQALTDYLQAWEKSNFATVIFYCYATKIQLQQAGDDPVALGNAMHAYAEGVGFAHGFKGIDQKIISDAQIDRVLTLLLAPEGVAPESYKFLNDATLLGNLDQVVEELQEIYGFTDEEITSFYVNDPS